MGEGGKGRALTKWAGIAAAHALKHGLCLEAGLNGGVRVDRVSYDNQLIFVTCIFIYRNGFDKLICNPPCPAFFKVALNA